MKGYSISARLKQESFTELKRQKLNAPFPVSEKKYDNQAVYLFMYLSTD
jgi:hypothetical protein